MIIVDDNDAHIRKAPRRLQAVGQTSSESAGPCSYPEALASSRVAVNKSFQALYERLLLEPILLESRLSNLISALDKRCEYIGASSLEFRLNGPCK